MIWPRTADQRLASLEFISFEFGRNIVSSKYLIIFPDPKRDDLEALNDYEMSPEDTLKPWTGVRIDKWSPASIVLNVGQGDRADLLGNPLSWNIVSTRLRDIIIRFAREAVQILPVVVFRKSVRSPSDYHLVNILGAIDAVPGKGKPRSKIVIDEITLQADRIPSDTHIMRLETHPLLTIVSKQLFDAIKKSGATGISALPLDFADN